jgi:3,4-dihydroxy 2-butanone 4-phosphate synthase/GTP cyclohydrolase II
MDTYEANVHLGFEPDARDYEVSAAMIKKLDVKSIRLLTNNPEKELSLREYGIDVTERIPLQLPTNENNLYYLQTKKERFGHKLELKEDS